MDGSVEVETEHVEKITRTTSLQVCIEDSGLKNDTLDETELYDATEYDNLQTDTRENESVDHHQSVNACNGMSTSLPNKINSHTEGHNGDSDTTSHVVSCDLSHLEARVGQDYLQLGLNHYCDENKNGDSSADDSVVASDTNAAGSSLANSLIQEDLDAELTETPAEVLGNEGIQHLQKKNHDCCDSAKDSITNENAPIDDYLVNGVTKHNSISGTEPDEFSCSVNDASSCLQNGVEQEREAPEINLLSDTNKATSDIPIGTVDVDGEAAESQCSDFTTTVSNVSNPTMDSRVDTEHTAVRVTEDEGIISSHESASNTDSMRKYYG
jgi:hypothetical protein